MERVKAGSLEASVGEPAPHKAQPNIVIDERLVVEDVSPGESRRKAIQTPIKNLKIDIPDSWNGLYGDISQDPVAIALMKRLEAGTLESSIQPQTEAEMNTYR